jgi:signal transduction histidine kinase
MVASLKEGGILEEVVKSLAEALNLTGCHIFLTSADGSSWIRACSFPEKADPASLDDPELGHLLHSHALPWEVHWCCQRGGHWVHLLACSLRNHQERLGLLLLERQQEFSEAERQLALAYQVVNLCALALRQACLYETTRAQVKELERLNLLKDDFLSTVSHELRTPMTNVRMALQMLQIACDNPKRQQHYFAIALKECNRQIDLINDLLDMQRLAAEKYLLQPEEIFLPHYLRDLVAAAQPLAQGKKQNLQLRLEEGIPPLKADPKALGRILRELLHNAVKYTAPEGSIRLQVTPEGEGILFVCSNSSEIPEAELPRIFEKFYRIPKADRWEHGGTGLGLALVKQLVERMGGQISVSSAEGWTHFRVWLPSAPPAATAESLEPAGAA